MAGMRTRNLVILAAVTLIVVVVAVITSLSRAPQSGKEKPLLFPNLKNTINETSEVIIRGRGRTVTLLREEDGWIVQEADGYPADFARLKSLLVGMTTLRAVEEKTSRPELYPRLGVEDPADPDASSHLVILKNEADQTLAELIIGKPRRDPASPDSSGLYVRRPDQAQSLLVEGRLDVSSQITDWFDQQLFSIEADRIESVVIRHPDGENVTVSRDEPGGDFSVEPLPEGREPQSEIILARMGTILENTFALNVASQKTFSFPEDHVKTTIRTFDGLIAETKAVRKNERNYVAFHFSVDKSRIEKKQPAETQEDTGAKEDAGSSEEVKEPNVSEEVAEYNDTVSGWVFTLPDHRYDLLVRRLDDLTRPE